MLEIHIEVADINRSKDLYSKLLNHKKIDSWDDNTACAFVLEDGTAFGLWTKGKRGIHNGQGGTHVHFAFQISPEEYSHYHQLIKNCGLDPLEHTWPNGQKSVYFFDYDGNQGEFMTCDWLAL